MMLQKVLEEIKNSKGTIRLEEISKKLGIGLSTVESMVRFLIQKGFLDSGEVIEETFNCEVGQVCSSGSRCPGSAECPFVMKLPKTYSLNNNQDEMMKITNQQ